MTIRRLTTICRQILLKTERRRLRITVSGSLKFSANCRIRLIVVLGKFTFSQCTLIIRWFFCFFFFHFAEWLVQWEFASHIWVNFSQQNTVKRFCVGWKCSGQWELLHFLVRRDEGEEKSLYMVSDPLNIFVPYNFQI